MTTASPRVTVLMAAYNAVLYVGDALRALRHSVGTHDFEVVLVDDGSTDGTADAAEMARFGPDLRVYRLPSNAGSAAARNFGASHARGEFIAVADADDLTLPPRISRQVNFLDSNPGIDVVGGQLLDFGDWGGPSPGWAFPTDAVEIERRFGRGRMGLAHPTTMYRRDWFESLGGYDEQLQRCEDLDLFLRGRRGRNYFALDDPLIHYRRPRRQVSWAYWWREERYRRATVETHRRRSAGEAVRFDQILERNSTPWTKASVAPRFMRSWLLEGRS
jgi:glycosyltransferase involved in cell wall biosynthesis